MSQEKLFRDHKNEGASWITLASGEYYPDILEDACDLYTPIIKMFGRILKSSESSARLFMEITQVKTPWMRLQLWRVFKRYVSYGTPVEMLKIKRRWPEILRDFGKDFRPINEVQAAYETRPDPDEALCALLWEYKSRGQKGYDLTERFFDLIQAHFPDLKIEGPKRAGQDIRLGDVFQDYPKKDRPVDFIIYGEKRKVLAVGLARYDSDRGGAQEDDRTGGYRDCATEILGYSSQKGLDLKVIFVNDGPGLLLGSMWEDYARIEEMDSDKIRVVTLRMVPDRITNDWLIS